MAALGSKVLRFASLRSTNDAAREMAQAGEEEGVAIIADEQTAGRGRQGRSWSSPPGAGLYASIILKPGIEPSKSAVITLGAAVAARETFVEAYGLDCDIKWPNDIIANGRKICGILVESALESNRLLYAIMGIGVNLCQRAFPEDIEQTATSLLIETGRLVEPADFFGELAPRLDRRYRQSIDEPEAVIASWQAASSYAWGCQVEAEAGGNAITGITRGITPTGALVIETDSGERREINSGEVRLRKGKGAN